MEPKTIKILLIEDNPGDIRLIQEIINEEKTGLYEMEVADSLADGIRRLAAGHVDVVLLDLALPDSMGINTFNKIKAKAPTTPIIVLTISDDGDVAGRAIHEGAQDYLVKGQFDRRMLARSIQYSIERNALLLEKERLIAKQRELLAHIKILNGLLPICSHCKRIRDSHGQWHEVETFIQNRTNTTFTHGICPQCAAKHYPDEELDGKQ